MLLRSLLTGWVFALSLRAEPCGKLYATDAFPSGAGTLDPRPVLYAWTEEKGEEPPSNMHDGRPAAALLGLGLEWVELDLRRETLSASTHTAGTLEFFDAFSHSRRKPACF